MISDADLITRVLLSKDRNAFAALVRRYQSGVRGLLRKLTHGDVALADDLAQETFIKAYKAIQSFRNEAKFSTWLYRIAYNAFISDARRRKPQELLDETLPEDAAPVESTQLDLKRDLAAAMANLTYKERMAIHVCYHQGLSHHEAAEVLGQPLGTIKTDINRGKEKLRRYLADWEERVCYE